MTKTLNESQTEALRRLSYFDSQRRWASTANLGGTDGVDVNLRTLKSLHGIGLVFGEKKATVGKWRWRITDEGRDLLSPIHPGRSDS